MSDFLIRTEDIPPKEILDLYVSTEQDEEIVSQLVGRSPILLEGSRGVGKSFLLRVAEHKLLKSIDGKKILPVHVQLDRSILIDTSDNNQFYKWVLARLSKSVVRALRKNGFAAYVDHQISIIAGGSSAEEGSPIDQIINQFETSYKNPGRNVDTTGIPSIYDFKNSVEDICEISNIKRINIFFDEAAHVLQPEHQRQFFTIFRDLRSPYISCNAAVYPGITSYGETFERAHDANTVRVERDVQASGYISQMKDIVIAQADSSTIKDLQKRPDEFAGLAYASTGNPRFLLKTLSMSPRLRGVADTIKQYYRNDIWGGVYSTVK